MWETVFLAIGNSVRCNGEAWLLRKALRSRKNWPLAVELPTFSLFDFDEGFKGDYSDLLELWLGVKEELLQDIEILCYRSKDNIPEGDCRELVLKLGVRLAIAKIDSNYTFDDLLHYLQQKVGVVAPADWEQHREEFIELLKLLLEFNREKITAIIESWISSDDPGGCYYERQHSFTLAFCSVEKLESEVVKRYLRNPPSPFRNDSINQLLKLAREVQGV